MEALGMIETRSMVSAIEAADIMVKTANVRLVGYEKTGAGIVTVFVRGSVADCKVSVDRAVSGAASVGEFLRAHVIPYPYDEVNRKLPVSIIEE